MCSLAVCGTRPPNLLACAVVGTLMSVVRSLDCHGRASPAQWWRWSVRPSEHTGSYESLKGCLYGVQYAAVVCRMCCCGGCRPIRRRPRRGETQSGTRQCLDTQERGQRERSGILYSHASGSGIVERRCRGSELRTTRSGEAYSNTLFRMTLLRMTTEGDGTYRCSTTMCRHSLPPLARPRRVRAPPPRVHGPHGRSAVSRTRSCWTCFHSTWCEH
jgi:hypothetical protein